MRLLILASLTTASLMAQTTLLEIYTNKAFLTQRFEVGSGAFATTVPAFVTNDTLFIASPCTINDRAIKEPKEADTPLQARIAQARKELNTLTQQYTALEAKERLFERVSFSDQSLDALKTTADGLMELVLETLEAKRTLKTRIETATTHLEALEAKQETGLIKPVELSLTCNAPSTLELRYEVPHLEAKRLTTFTGESDEEHVNIEQAVEITHALGEELENIALRLYSFGFNQNLAPSPFQPLKLTPMPPMRTMALRSSLPASTQEANAAEVALESKEIWEAYGIDLPSGERTQVVFDKQRVFADFEVEVDGYGSVFAYMKSTFTPQATVEAGQTHFILNGLLLGERYTPQYLRDEEAHIYFGKHDLIGVEKKITKDYTTESAFGGKQATEKAWKYTLTNRSSTPQEVTLLERLPISSHEDITIKRSGDGPTQVSDEGKVSWNVTLSPQEKTTILFGYTLTRPIEKQQ
jgi:hypothetical protein